MNLALLENTRCPASADVRGLSLRRARIGPDRVALLPLLLLVALVSWLAQTLASGSSVRRRLAGYSPSIPPRAAVLEVSADRLDHMSIGTASTAPHRPISTP